MAGSGIEWSTERKLRDLAYADDICLLANDTSDMRQMTETLLCERGKVGLRVNAAVSEDQARQFFK